ncbi:hypothetical protein FDH01_gp286 [Acinetobacter phage vB_AbaM_ME3]|uniref:Uncharacterized protein n=1 Tax=Acinetobacter phage vB_AbaM_ME3 TaxID=1837876 RepID=A0A172Q0F7_9CAUD|nr:hypothetical protein FDH01_gp286 [Acinetobacter phage vB_AbaM_ME3]AND75336.1 hypothetical protein ME3_175 [Acinetobacter phage vB_AbaM_ME3]
MSENINSIPYLEQIAKWLISGHPKRNLNQVSTFTFGKDESNSQHIDVEFWKEHFFDIFDKALNKEGFKLTHLKYDVSPYFLEFNYESC